MRLIREEKAFIREAVLLMLPMILQNFVTFSMSMADTFMVGVLGETALAAVTMANSPFYVMQLMIFGVQSGMSVLVAQYHGRGDQEAINRVMGIALFVSTTITGLLAITAFCIPEQIMRVFKRAITDCTAPPDSSRGASAPAAGESPAPARRCFLSSASTSFLLPVYRIAAHLAREPLMFLSSATCRNRRNMIV